METIEVDTHGTLVWEQTIYQTQQLTDSNGRAPETVVARQISDSLDSLGVDHRIHYDFAPVSMATQNPVCENQLSVAGGRTVGEPDLHDGPALRDAPLLPDWNDYLNVDAPMVAKDSNLLLTDYDGGGCSITDGHVAVSGAAPIANDPGYVENDDTTWGHAVWRAMHEVAHNMNFDHYEHPGMAWNGGGFYHMTPFGPPDLARAADQNLCGEDMEERQEDAPMYELYYHDCVYDYMQIAAGGGGGGNGDGGNGGGGGGDQTPGGPDEAGFLRGNPALIFVLGLLAAAAIQQARKIRN